MSENKSFEILFLNSTSYATLGFIIIFFTILTFDPDLLPKENLYLKAQIGEIDKMTCTQLANYLIQNDYEQNNQYDQVYQHAKIVYDKEKCFQ